MIGAGAALLVFAPVGFLNNLLVAGRPDQWGAYTESVHRVLGRWWKYYAVAGAALLVAGLLAD